MKEIRKVRHNSFNGNIDGEKKFMDKLVKRCLKKYKYSNKDIRENIDNTGRMGK